MEGLAKIALNAQRARQMADEAGLVPSGSWKWALRNLRDERGGLLQGKELAEAKEQIGKLPNNTRQQLTSLARKAGNNKEVGAVGTDELPLTEALKAKIPRNEVGANRDVSRNVMVGDQQSVDNIGHLIDEDQDGITGMLAKLKGVQHDVHTHPFRPAARLVNPKRETEKALAPVRAEYEQYAKDTPYIFTEEWKKQALGTMEKRTLQMNEAATEIGRKGPGLTTPSGSTYNLLKPKEYGKDDMSLLSLMENEQGDYKSMLLTSTMNPNAKSTIYDPLYGNESVHKVRPDGLRSVFFKNKGQYE